MTPRYSELIIGEPLTEGSGIVRLSKKLMEDLKVKPGDIVEIMHCSFTPIKISAKVAQPLPEDEPKDVIRLSYDKMLEAGFEPGMCARVSKSLFGKLKRLIDSYRKDVVELEVPTISEEHVIEDISLERNNHTSSFNDNTI